MKSRVASASTGTGCCAVGTKVFAVDTDEDRRLLQQYDGWYQDLKNKHSVILSGADADVPPVGRRASSGCCWAGAVAGIWDWSRGGKGVP